jgi:hypothetical protein
MHRAARRGSDYASAFATEPEPADVYDEETTIEAEGTPRTAKSESAEQESVPARPGETEEPPQTSFDATSESDQDPSKSTTSRRRQK